MEKKLILTVRHKGCVRPGEMLLVLGRPGSGCSTFLKVIGNQRYGYESIDGDVLYGGTDSSTMAKNYRSEGMGTDQIPSFLKLTEQSPITRRMTFIMLR